MYRLGALAGGEFAEDAADDPGLGRVDLPLAAHLLAVTVEPLHDAVAVAEAAAGFALLDAAAQTAAGLGGEVFQEQGPGPGRCGTDPRWRKRSGLSEE